MKNAMIIFSSMLLVCVFFVTTVAAVQTDVAEVTGEVAVQEKIVEPGQEEPVAAGPNAQVKAANLQPKPVPSLFGFGEDRNGLMNRSSSLSSSTANNITKIVESKNGQVYRTAEISFDGESVSVLVSKKFNRQQWDELIDDAPNLLEYAESFPQASGEFDVDITVGLSQTFSADSVEEFGKIYPAIHRRYARLLLRNGNMRAIRRVPLGGIEGFGGMPGIRPLPLPMGLTEVGPGADKIVLMMVKRMKEQIAKTEIELEELKFVSEELAKEFGEDHSRTHAALQKLKVTLIKQQAMQKHVTQLEANLVADDKDKPAEQTDGAESNDEEAGDSDER